MSDYLADLQSVWPLIVQQPWPFLAIGLAIFVVGAVAGLFFRNVQTRLLKAKLVRRDEAIAALESEISYSKAFHESPPRGVKGHPTDLALRSR